MTILVENKPPCISLYSQFTLPFSFQHVNCSTASERLQEAFKTFYKSIRERKLCSMLCQRCPIQLAKDELPRHKAECITMIYNGNTQTHSFIARDPSTKRGDIGIMTKQGRKGFRATSLRYKVIRNMSREFRQSPIQVLT